MSTNKTKTEAQIAAKNISRNKSYHKRKSEGKVRKELTEDQKKLHLIHSKTYVEKIKADPEKKEIFLQDKRNYSTKRRLEEPEIVKAIEKKSYTSGTSCGFFAKLRSLPKLDPVPIENWAIDDDTRLWIDGLSPWMRSHDNVSQVYLVVMIPTINPFNNQIIDDPKQVEEFISTNPNYDYWYYTGLGSGVRKLVFSFDRHVILANGSSIAQLATWYGLSPWLIKTIRNPSTYLGQQSEAFYMLSGAVGELHKSNWHPMNVNMEIEKYLSLKLDENVADTDTSNANYDAGFLRGRLGLPLICPLEGCAPDAHQPPDGMEKWATTFHFNDLEIKKFNFEKCTKTNWNLVKRYVLASNLNQVVVDEQLKEPQHFSILM